MAHELAVVRSQLRVAAAAMALAPAVVRSPALVQPVVLAASALAAAHWPALGQQAAASRSALVP
jgi:hypothetical protein